MNKNKIVKSIIWLMVLCSGMGALVLLASKFSSFWPLPIVQETKGILGVVSLVLIGLISTGMVLGWVPTKGISMVLMMLHVLIVLMVIPSWMYAYEKQQKQRSFGACQTNALEYARYSNTQQYGIQGAWDSPILMFSEERKAFEFVPTSHKLVAGNQDNTESLIYVHSDFVLLEQGVLSKHQANWHQGVWALVWDPKRQQTVWVIAVHTDSPAGPQRDANRRFFYAHFAQELKALRGQIDLALKKHGFSDKKHVRLMMGDFNGTYHSDGFKKMIALLEQDGWSWQHTAATWPTPTARYHMGWGIDHAFVGSEQPWSVKPIVPLQSDHMQLSVCLDMSQNP